MRISQKTSAVKELQTLSEDMSDWLSGSKRGIAALVCVLVMCLYYWSLGATEYSVQQQQFVADIERLTHDKADLLQH